MQLPDSVQNILAYGQGFKDGMKDGHICGFHDAIVCAVHDLTGLLKKYHELEKEYAGLQVKAYRERMENMPQLEQPPEQKHGRWEGGQYDGYADDAPVYDSYYCSECGEEIWQDTIPDFRFCPHCGACMDAGEDQGVKKQDAESSAL